MDTLFLYKKNANLNETTWGMPWEFQLVCVCHALNGDKCNHFNFQCAIQDNQLVNILSETYPDKHWKSCKLGSHSGSHKPGESKTISILRKSLIPRTISIQDNQDIWSPNAKASLSSHLYLNVILLILILVNINSSFPLTSSRKYSQTYVTTQVYVCVYVCTTQHNRFSPT